MLDSQLRFFITLGALNAPETKKAYQSISLFNNCRICPAVTHLKHKIPHRHHRAAGNQAENQQQAADTGAFAFFEELLGVQL